MSQFVEDVESGDRLTGLLALRRKLADAIDQCVEPRELAALALRLQRVLAEVEELGGADNEETDDLAERRRRKLSAPVGQRADAGGDSRA